MNASSLICCILRSRYAESYGRAQEFSPDIILSSSNSSNSSSSTSVEAKADSKDSARRDQATSSSSAVAAAAGEDEEAPEVAEMSYDDSSAARQRNLAELSQLQSTVESCVVLVIPGDIVHLYLSNGDGPGWLPLYLYSV